MMHRIFYFPEADDPLTAVSRTHCYANFHGCFFAQLGDLKRAGQHLALGGDQATIFHLTAEDGIHQGAADARETRDQCQRFLNGLEAFIAAGGRFVWSVETETPVSPLTAEQAQSLRFGLGRLAHLVHCSNFAVARNIQATLDLDWRKLVVVPPGSYRPQSDGWQRNKLEADRADPGLDPNRRRLIHFGRPHPVSGTDRLLAYWQDAASKGASLTLLGALADAIKPNDAAALRSQGIELKVGHGTVADLAGWIAAADFVVLPYERFTGSMELMLTLSCGRPAIIPALPPLLELVTPEQEALAYDPEGGDAAFAACLDHALELDTDQRHAMGVAAARRADALAWRMLGRQLADSFLRVAADGAPMAQILEPTATAPGAIKPRLVS